MILVLIEVKFPVCQDHETLLVVTMGHLHQIGSVILNQPPYQWNIEPIFDNQRLHLHQSVLEQIIKVRCPPLMLLLRWFEAKRLPGSRDISGASLLVQLDFLSYQGFLLVPRSEVDAQTIHSA